jgi:hypothetical protein
LFKINKLVDTGGHHQILLPKEELQLEVLDEMPVSIKILLKN